MKCFTYLCLLSILFGCASDKSVTNFTNALYQTFDDYKSFYYYTYPESASYNGMHDYSDRLTTQSVEAGQMFLDSIQTFKQAAEDVPRESLNKEDKLNRELFIFSMKETLDHYGNGISSYLGFTQQGGFHIYAPQIIDYQPIESDKDIDSYYSRLKQFKIECHNIIEMLKDGMKKGVVLPCNVSEQVKSQLERLASQKTEDSPFYSIYDKNEKLKADPLPLKKMINEYVIPGYKELYAFMSDVYHPSCRSTVGIHGVAGGKEHYETLVKKYTTSDITPDEVFDLGKQEVERIRKSMVEVKDKLGYENVKLTDVFADIRTNPKYYYADKNELMDDYRKILTKMDERLPQLFGKLPKAPYDLKEIETYRAEAAPMAYYYPVPQDGSRPGYFYVNTYDLPSRPKHTMTALALHEAVPGHHLQIALATEMENVPWFRKQMGVTAFVEGWGLYAEYLGYETNMYEDPLQEMGALSFEMWRACRLVVDAGIHYKGWTKEEAVAFMKANVPLSELDINSEIDRYIAWPGQALAYKTGELKLKAFRTNAEQELGDKFDIKSFHDEILSNGSIPMEILEQKVNHWITTSK